MAHIVLFHHVLGLTLGVQQLASALSAAGHQVVTPDLFAGRTFADIEGGLQHAESLGDAELLGRADRACSQLPSEVIFAGLSLGVAPAEHLFATRPGALGALFIHAFVDPGATRREWPTGRTVGVFGMDEDPFFVGDGDLAAARRCAQTYPGLEIHLYQGTGHLFTEPSLDDYDPSATRRLASDAVEVIDRTVPA